MNYRYVAAAFVLVFATATTVAVVSKRQSRSPSSDEIVWRLVASQDFEKNFSIAPADWRPESYQEKSRYADSGPFHQIPSDQLPVAYRSVQKHGFLKIDSYSRSKKKIEEFVQVVDDPSGKKNRVLRLRSGEHTDGTVIASASALPPQYKICLRGGFADFGSGDALPNGYQGDERAEPWIKAPSINENGLYWLAILSEEPRPRNNIWIHHHRKVVIDSDNNFYPESNPSSWSKVWNGKSFESSGRHPLMMFVLDADNRDKSWNFDRVGMPFISFAGGRWNAQAEVNEVRAVDAYLDRQWYRTCVWKTDRFYGFEMEGEFQHGGKTRYAAEIPLERVYLANATGDYFMAGDPHINFYEGTAYYDDIELYVPESLPEERSMRLDGTAKSGFAGGIEGPAVSKTGTLYAPNFGSNGTVGKFSMPALADTTLAQPQPFARVPDGGVVNSLAFDATGSLYGVDYVKHRILKFDSEGKVTEVAASPSLSQPNDFVIASWGKFFLSDPDFAKGTGKLWSWSKAEGFKVVDPALELPNGIALSRDENFLFVNESKSRRIWRYAFEGDERILSARALFAELADQEVMLDGMKMDSRGVLYVALHGGGRIARFLSSGERLGDLQLAGKHPTNLALREDGGVVELWVTVADSGAFERVQVRSDRSFVD